jgi:hypothetical protein
MKNIQIEKTGLEWLKNKLELEGWKVERVHKKGYDLIVINNTETRYVEVKTTAKDNFSQRWLEEKEMEMLEEKREQYFVYLITNATNLPKLHILNNIELSKRKRKISKMQWFDFKI